MDEVHLATAEVLDLALDLLDAAERLEASGEDRIADHLRIWEHLLLDRLYPPEAPSD